MSRKTEAQIFEEMRQRLMRLTVAQLKQIAKDERISLGYDGCRKDSIVGRIVSERRNRARLTGEDPNAHPWRRWNSVSTIPVSHNPQEYGL